METNLKKAMMLSLTKPMTAIDVVIDDPNYPVKVFCMDNQFCVALPYEFTDSFEYRFNKLALKSLNLASGKFLCLVCDDLDSIDTFVAIARDFGLYGPNGENRNRLLNSPYSWFDNWKQLVGNKATQLMIFDLIGELKSLLVLNQLGKKPVWTALDQSSHDIECNDGSYEVKTTTSHHGYDVHISSPEQLQLENGNKLSLVFVRVQKSDLGYTLKSLRDEVVKQGIVKANLIDDYLKSKGYVQDSEEYSKIGYTVYEMKLYPVDEDFPRLTINSFIGGKLPKGVTSYTYTITLPNDQNTIDLTSYLN